MSPTEHPLCRQCRQGTMHPFERENVFHPPGTTVTVKTLAVRCSQCAAETVLASQHEENLVRLQAREAEYGPYLTGEAIFSFRRKYGLTAAAAAKVFGKGAVAFSRYENETSYPDKSTTKLLRLALSRPDVLKQLADDSGVEIPLWSERSQHSPDSRAL